ncbi:MAG TPA: pyridoxamine 5'-phosphate oxidase family protein, partial [Ktedonobacterales bacterium]|nr:pyridoxamine 5'-phosphate oxidase family protein [Ktedonobacterales bacterium]
MNEPITTLDPRFSDSDAVATTWEETRRVLETAELFWLVTVRADGRPHATPLVAVWYDGSLHFCTGDTEQKAVNLQGNPHVLLTTGSAHWNEGLDVEVEGDAVQVTDDDTLKRLAQVWTTKWDGRWQYEVRDSAFHSNEDDTILVFSVKP